MHGISCLIQNTRDSENSRRASEDSKSKKRKKKDLQEIKCE